MGTGSITDDPSLRTAQRASRREPTMGRIRDRSTSSAPCACSAQISVPPSPDEWPVPSNEARSARPEERATMGPRTRATAADVATANFARRPLGATTKRGAMTNRANCCVVKASPTKTPAQIHHPRRAQARLPRHKPMATRSCGWKKSTVVATTGGTHAMSKSTAGSHRHRPRPEDRSRATTPAMKKNQLR